MKKELPISLLNTTREVASGMHMPASGQAFSSSNAEDGEALVGGVGDSKTPKDFDIKDLREGTKVEMEHTKDRRIAREIAMDHLTEDPLYYKKLKKVEARAKRILRKNALGLLDVPGGMGEFVDPELDSDESVDDSEVMGFRGIPQNPGLAQESEEYDGETAPFLKGRGDSGEDYNVEELPPINNDIDKRGSENSMLKDLVDLKKFFDKTGNLKFSSRIHHIIKAGQIYSGPMYIESKSCRWPSEPRPAYALDTINNRMVISYKAISTLNQFDYESMLQSFSSNEVYSPVGGKGFARDYLDPLFTNTTTSTFKEYFPIIKNLGDAYDLLWLDWKDNQEYQAEISACKMAEVKVPINPNRYGSYERAPAVERDGWPSYSHVIIKYYSDLKWPGNNSLSMYGMGADGQLYALEESAPEDFNPLFPSTWGFLRVQTPLESVVGPNSNIFFSTTGDRTDELWTFGPVTKAGRNFTSYSGINTLDEAYDKLYQKYSTNQDATAMVDIQNAKDFYCSKGSQAAPRQQQSYDTL